MSVAHRNKVNSLEAMHNKHINVFLIYPCRQVLGLQTGKKPIEHLQAVQIFFPFNPMFTCLFGLN